MRSEGFYRERRTSSHLLQPGGYCAETHRTMLRAHRDKIKAAVLGNDLKMRYYRTGGNNVANVATDALLSKYNA